MGSFVSGDLSRSDRLGAPAVELTRAVRRLGYALDEVKLRLQVATDSSRAQLTRLHEQLTARRLTARAALQQAHQSELARASERATPPPSLAGPGVAGAAA